MISLDELDYEDYVEVANVLVKELQDENCDIIIALTHMREPNDIRLGTISSQVEIPNACNVSSCYGSWIMNHTNNWKIVFKLEKWMVLTLFLVGMTIIIHTLLNLMLQY